MTASTCSKSVPSNHLSSTNGDGILEAPHVNACREEGGLRVLSEKKQRRARYTVVSDQVQLAQHRWGFIRLRNVRKPVLRQAGKLLKLVLIDAVEIGSGSRCIEGIPGVILEAAAQGTPAVATDVGSIGEAVRDGATGRLVPPGDMHAFCTAVTELLTDAGERDRLGRGARAFVGEHYALDAITDKFEALYEKLAM